MRALAFSALVCAAAICSSMACSDESTTDPESPTLAEDLQTALEATLAASGGTGVRISQNGPGLSLGARSSASRL